MSAISEATLGVSLKLRAEAENIALVRHGLAGVAEALGMSEVAVTDITTAVTEACTNAVLHAYDDGGGVMEVDAGVVGTELVVSVRDFGSGIRPRPDIERTSLRLGLALIAALSSSFSISGGGDSGTRVTMHFALAPTDEKSNGNGAVTAPTEGAELAVGDSRMLVPVLSRIARALGSRHDLAMETLSDAVLVADAIAAEEPRITADEPVRMVIGDDNEMLHFRVGPLATGQAGKLKDSLAIPELGGSLASLADEVEVEPSEPGYEFLRISFKAPRRSAL